MRIERLTADRVAVIGDIHLAHAGAPMGFSGDEDALASLLERLREEHDAVVINGDLYDLDRGRWPWTYREERAAADTAYPRLRELLTSEVFVLTSGNHDHQLGWVAAVEICGPRGRAWVEHGDRFDALIKRWRAFTRLVTWTSGKMAAVPSVLDTMRHIERLLTRGAGEGSEGCPIEEGARRFLSQRPDLDVMVIGHTHVETIRPVGGAWLVNPGESMSAPFTWTCLDLAQGIVCNFRGDSKQSVEVRRAVLALRTSDCQE